MTFSITARCERTNQFGVAVSTAVPGVGGLVPYVKAGVGAIASQSFVNPYIGINGLKYLEAGLSAAEVLERVVAEDPVSDLRQVSIVDKNGKSAVYTGAKCDTWNGDISSNNYAIAGNMLVGEATILAMKRTFEETTELALAERLLLSLEAGQASGGDKRGKQSAALYVVHTEEYPYIDLRVDEHADPVKELRRVYSVASKELMPFVNMLPTHKNPAGTLSVEHSRRLGILKDDE